MPDAIESGSTCECNAGKPHGATACDQCRWLDGDGALEAAIVGLLRLGGELSIYGLAAQSGYSTRHVLRGLRRLERRGRVLRREPDLFGDERTVPALYRLHDRRSGRRREPLTARAA